MQHSGAEAEAVYRLEVFGEQHWQAVKVAAVQAVSDVEEAAQLAVLEHCSGAAIAVEAVQAVVPEHCFLAARTVVEAPAQFEVLEYCLAVARTVVEEAARHYWLAELAAEEAASKTEEFA